jgi:hypothetical protein
MKEEKARTVALQIRDEFEELLDEKNIAIPSDDREGDPDEARLYGAENARIVEAIFGLLMEHYDESDCTDDSWDASHPYRELAILICDEFEELLAEKDIMIDSSDREGRPEEACLYGSEYYALEDAIVEILVDAAREKGRRAQVAIESGVDDKARRDVRAM